MAADIAIYSHIRPPEHNDVSSLRSEECKNLPVIVLTSKGGNIILFVASTGSECCFRRECKGVSNIRY